MVCKSKAVMFVRLLGATRCIILCDFTNSECQERIFYYALLAIDKSSKVEYYCISM